MKNDDDDTKNENKNKDAAPSRRLGGHDLCEMTGSCVRWQMKFTKINNAAQLFIQ